MLIRTAISGHVSFVARFVWQDEETREITFYMKGADVVMTAIVQYNDWLEEEVGVPEIFLVHTAVQM